MRQPGEYIGAVLKREPASIPRVTANPPTPKRPHPMRAFRESLEPRDGEGTAAHVAHGVTKKRTPAKVGDNAYTDIQKMGAYRAYMQRVT